MGELPHKPSAVSLSTPPPPPPIHPTLGQAFGIHCIVEFKLLLCRCCLLLQVVVPENNKGGEGGDVTQPYLLSDVYARHPLPFTRKVGCAVS
jgi:hypothetical protein